MKQPRQNSDKSRYTENELMARLKFVVGICLAITLMGIVFVVLYSIIFVTQPLGAISPVDSKFFELIIPIATFLTGTLSGIMLAGNSKEAQMKALEAANARPTPTPPMPSAMPQMSPTGFNFDSAKSFGNGFGNTRIEPNFLPQTSGGFVNNGGKLGPVQDPHPEI